MTSLIPGLTYRETHATLIAVISAALLVLLCIVMDIFCHPRAFFISGSVVDVPEPASGLLLGGAVGVMWFVRKCKIRK